MNTKVTIIMYHYVRDLINSRYPQIKGLDLKLFKNQIAYLEKHYNFIKIEDLIEAINGNNNLPKKAVLLTFDDPFIDHYMNVFPLLDAKNIQGTFFPSIKPILECQILDVHKLHFILACQNNHDLLLKNIFKEIKNLKSEFQLESIDYYNHLMDKVKKNRFDNHKITFIKRLLQRELPRECRDIILTKLFDHYIQIPENIFSKELYMNMDQLKCMKRKGMFIGNHSYSHYWLNSLNYTEQERELDLSIEIFNEINGQSGYKCISYPFGAYNNDTLKLVQKKGFDLGIIVNFEIADISQHNRYLLPRIDTNDIPKYKNVKKNKWFDKS